MASRSQQLARVVSYNRDLSTGDWSIFKCFELLSGKYPGFELIKYLQCHGILPESVNCEKCALPMKVYQGTCSVDGCRYVCRRRNKKSGRTCNKEMSVRTNTLFAKSRISISEMVNIKKTFFCNFLHNLIVTYC